ncbi:MAG TPA: sensor histidine kinase, partial [Acidimicrobiales bacterium]
LPADVPGASHRRPGCGRGTNGRRHERAPPARPRRGLRRTASCWCSSAPAPGSFSGADRFWRAQEGRSGTGAGLGLSIVEGIATEHGGTATAANAEDGGAVFELHLPMNNA